MHTPQHQHSLFWRQTQQHARPQLSHQTQSIDTPPCHPKYPNNLSGSLHLNRLFRRCSQYIHPQDAILLTPQSWDSTAALHHQTPHRNVLWMSGPNLLLQEVIQRLLNNHVDEVLVLQNHRRTQFLPSPTPLLQHHPSPPLPRVLQVHPERINLITVQNQVPFVVSSNDGHPLLPPMMTTSPPWQRRAN